MLSYSFARLLPFYPKIDLSRGFALAIAISGLVASILPNGAKSFYVQIHFGGVFLFQNQFGFQSILVISF